MAVARDISYEDATILRNALCAAPDFARDPQGFLLDALGSAAGVLDSYSGWAEGAETVAREVVNRLKVCGVERATPPLGRLAWALHPRVGPHHQFRLAALCKSMGWRRPPRHRETEDDVIEFPGTIGRFEIGELLGRGSYGVVYRARDPKAKTDVALKVLTRPGENNPELELSIPDLDRVIRPTEDPAKTEDGYFYFPMRLVTGGSLRDLIRPKKGKRVKMDWREAVGIVLDISRTLIELHRGSNGIAHQDLKPENILMDGGVPHIADFGLAAELGKRHEPKARDRAVGTWEYMAPEVFRKFYWKDFEEPPKRKPIDRRADIFSLGVILYELLTAEHPWGDNWGSRKESLDDTPDGPQGKEPDLPDALDEVCLKCLAPVPGNRMGNASLLAKGLQAVLDAHPERPVAPRTVAPGALPTRQEEESYLAYSRKEIERQALRYSPLQGLAEVRGPGKNEALVRLFEDVPEDVQMTHDSRRRNSSRKREYEDILVAFDELKRAAVLGAPGSGKSTTLRRLALELIKRAEADHRKPVPVFVALRDWIGEESLEEFLSSQAPHIGHLLLALGRAGRIVLLLDGLNELPHRTRQMKDIRRVAGELRETSVFVSCRLEDYKGPLDMSPPEPGIAESREPGPDASGPELQSDFDKLTLVPFSRQRILAAVRQWVSTAGKPVEMADRFFWQLAGDPQLEDLLRKWLQADPACEEAFWSLKDPSENKEVYAKTIVQDDDLWRRHIPNRRSLLKLASNPQMLTMLFLVWTQGGDKEGEERLPRNRGDLFGKFVERLLRREKLLIGNVLQPAGARLLNGLADLAWNMQREKPAAQDGPVSDGTLVAMPRAGAARLLGDENLLERACGATLLEGGDMVHFRHQLLQEYFAARAWQTRLDTFDPAELWPKSAWWERTGWEETAVLLAGLYPENCTPVIRRLAEAQPEVAALCVAESGAEVPASLIEQLRVAWSRRMTGPLSDAEPEARAAMGRALGRPLLGCVMDTRQGIGLRSDGLPDIDWVKIPAGEFLYGEQKERRRVGAFRIARYPVTNAQYQAFLVAEDGYKEDDWWDGLDNPNRTPAPSRWPELNCPRETVSWHEATAFCKWLTHKLGYDKRGLEVRLPTEWEWERAARGTGGREFPWGAGYIHGYANVDETYGENPGPHNLQRTSAVGIYYPQDKSTAEIRESDAIFDLAGNVWEWCLNEHEASKQTGGGGTKARVLRGGSWYYDRSFARAGCRDDFIPGSRSDLIGFRVVCSSPIRTER